MNKTFIEELIRRFESDNLHFEWTPPLNPVIVVAGRQLELRPTLLKLYRLTPAQRSVADFILKNLDDCAFLPAATIAGHAGVSEASVVRFLAAAGFTGYNQFLDLMRSQVKHVSSAQARSAVDDQALRQKPDSLEQVMQADMENLRKTFSGLDREEFASAVETLHAAKCIYCVGLRTSAALASFLQMSLRYIGRSARQIRLGDGAYWEDLMEVSGTDAVVAFSFRNYNATTNEILDYLKERDVPVILITDSPLAPPVRNAQTALVVHRTTPGTVIDSGTAVMSLLNALILRLTLRDEDKAVAALAATELRSEQRWGAARSKSGRLKRY